MDSKMQETLVDVQMKKMFLRLIFYFILFYFMLRWFKIMLSGRSLNFTWHWKHGLLKKGVMKMKVRTTKNTLLIETWHSCCNTFTTIYFSTTGFCSSTNVKISGTNAFVDVCTINLKIQGVKLNFIIVPLTGNSIWEWAIVAALHPVGFVYWNKLLH